MTVALDSFRRVLELGPDDPLPATLSVDQAAGCLGIGRGTAYEGVRDGSIPSVRIRRRILIPTDRLLALLESSPDQGQPSSDGADTAPVGVWSFSRREPSFLEDGTNHDEPENPL
jgi:excisionase family DNA binding protein